MEALSWLPQTAPVGIVSSPWHAAPSAWRRNRGRSAACWVCVGRHRKFVAPHLIWRHAPPAPSGLSCGVLPYSSPSPSSLPPASQSLLVANRSLLSSIESLCSHALFAAIGGNPAVDIPTTFTHSLTRPLTHSLRQKQTNKNKNSSNTYHTAGSLAIAALFSQCVRSLSPPCGFSSPARPSPSTIAHSSRGGIRTRSFTGSMLCPWPPSPSPASPSGRRASSPRERAWWRLRPREGTADGPCPRTSLACRTDIPPLGARYLACVLMARQWNVLPVRLPSVSDIATRTVAVRARTDGPW